MPTDQPLAARQRPRDLANSSASNTSSARAAFSGRRSTQVSCVDDPVGPARHGKTTLAGIAAKAAKARFSNISPYRAASSSCGS